MSPLATAFLQIAQEEGNTISLESIRNSCLSKISGGEVKSLINSSLNSKSFAFNISLPADKLFAEVSQAIRAYNTGTVTAIQFDFSRLA